MEYDSTSSHLTSAFVARPVVFMTRYLVSWLAYNSATTINYLLAVAVSREVQPTNSLVKTACEILQGLGS